MSSRPVYSAKAHLLHEGEAVLAAAVEQVGIIRRSGRILAKTVHAFASDNIASGENSFNRSLRSLRVNYNISIFISLK